MSRASIKVPSCLLQKYPSLTRTLKVGKDHKMNPSKSKLVQVSEMLRRKTSTLDLRLKSLERAQLKIQDARKKITRGTNDFEWGDHQPHELQEATKLGSTAERYDQKRRQDYSRSKDMLLELPNHAKRLLENEYLFLRF